MNETTHINEFFDILKKQLGLYGNTSYSSVSQIDRLKCGFQNSIQQNKD